MMIFPIGSGDKKEESEEEKEFKDLNDREEVKGGSNIMIHDELIHGSHNESDDINNRQSFDQESKKSRNVLKIENFDEENKCIQEGTNQEKNENEKLLEEDEKINNDYRTSVQNEIFPALGRLDTVGEATVEETVKQDLTAEEKLQPSFEAPLEESEIREESEILDPPESSRKNGEGIDNNGYNSKINQDKNYEPELGIIKPEDPSQKELVKDNINPLNPVQLEKMKNPNFNDELGLGSMELLDVVLKQYKHCLK